MPRRGSYVYACLLILLVSLLLTSCSRTPNLQSLPQMLADKAAAMSSYHVSLTLQPADGRQLSVHQWYKAPDCLRTDVANGDELVYQFFLAKQKLVVLHAPSGQREELRLSSDTTLFTEPLLLALWQQGQSAHWQQAEQTFLGDFSWRDWQGKPQPGSLSLDCNSLLPQQVHLWCETEQILHLHFAQVTLDPILAEQIFQP